MWKKSDAMDGTKELVVDFRVGVSWKLPSDRNLTFAVYCHDKRVTQDANILPQVFTLFRRIFSYSEYKLIQQEKTASFYQ